jgi:hypothetical protein
MAYCIWHLGLSAKEAAEWDAMVAQLTPSPKLIEAVGAFQFSTRPQPPAATQAAATQPAEAPPDFYRRGKELILNAMQGSPATQPAGEDKK